ncbi:MAG: hypothetical protein Q4D81_11045, partial [Eubacteriales bacterium]|nr:hypothetical protein [Eubacteriales bacterium]
KKNTRKKNTWKDEDPDEGMEIPFGDSRGKRPFFSGKTEAGSSGTGRFSGETSPFGKTGKKPAGLPSAREGKRPRAVYVPPHTPEEKKPFIARAASIPGGSGTASLRKGMPAPETPSYDVGSRVRHVKFGDGVVIAIEKAPRDYKVTVDFDECGRKVMYAGFAKLKEI